MNLKRHALICLWLNALAFVAQGQSPFLRLWENTPVRANDVTLVPYLPSQLSTLPNGMSDSSINLNGHHPTPAIIVCPGGSYCWHDYETEGTCVAEWLQGKGIAAFLLKYRVLGIGPYVFHTRLISRGHKYPDALCDIQRAIQYVREHAAHFNINPKQLGVMGFSAGGHLCMSAAAYASTDFLTPLGISHSTNLRPDFVAAIYPVVTMQKPYVHKRSRNALIGEYPTHRQIMCDSLSLELHIPYDCPPVFLINCMDDPIVKWENSVLLDSALTANNVPHKYIIYEHGGHGFGAAAEKFSEETKHWQEAFTDWLETQYTTFGK
jgi:acetyl esterase/lipase